MNKEEIKGYYNEINKLEKEKFGYLEADLKVPKRIEKRIKEVNFIIDNLDSEQLLNNARRIIRAYQNKYGTIEVEDVKD